MRTPRSALALAAFLVICFQSATFGAPPHPARIHYIDVGQAEAILLEFDKSAILIDAGGEATNDLQQRNHLVNYLNNFFSGRPDLHRTIDAIIISHPHMDHTMMLPDVAQAFTVRNLIDGGENKGSGIQPLNTGRAWINSHGGHYYQVTIADTKKNNFANPALAAIQAGEPGLFFKLLGGRAGCTNANNNSVMLAMAYKGSRFIFTGDAEDEGDQTCATGEIQGLLHLYSGTNVLKADVYKVDHHGSRNGTNQAWITAISPKISIISAGKNDPAHRIPGAFHAWQFGHPRESVVQILEAFTSGTRAKKNVATMDKVMHVINRSMEKAVYCTCWDGDIVIDGASLAVRTAH